MSIYILVNVCLIVYLIINAHHLLLIYPGVAPFVPYIANSAVFVMYRKLNFYYYLQDTPILQIYQPMILDIQDSNPFLKVMSDGAVVLFRPNIFITKVFKLMGSPGPYYLFDIENLSDPTKPIKFFW
jgi:hypothetical protein